MTKIVTDPAAAAFLTSPNTRYLLEPFMRAETTMAEAAVSVNEPLSAFHRRVRQMLTLGLVVVTREEVRGGHRVKLYRATSRAFVVPLEATPSVDLETYLNDGFRGSATILSRGVAKVMERSTPRWGFRIYLSDTGSVFQEATALDESTTPLEPGAATNCWYGDSGVKLKPEAARNFKRELQELYEKYLEGADDEGEPHFFFAGFTAV